MLKPIFKSSPLSEPLRFQSSLLAWFDQNGKDYPWRRTHDPYAILISEVMLQQTQISTVLGKNFYTRFLQTFPTIHSLATTEDEPLLKAWEGLGYYRRARMLRETAKAVLSDHHGMFPQSLEALQKLPGVGPYTAGAIRAFAFDLPSVLVDGNIARVIARLFDFQNPIDESSHLKWIWKTASSIADASNSRRFHSAIMELGQTICRPKSPDCHSCPVSAFCKTKHPENLPIKKRKIAITPISEHAIWIRNEHQQILLHQESGKRRTGLWKLPIRPISEIETLAPIASLTYPITRYRVCLSVHLAHHTLDVAQPQEGEYWIDEENLNEIAIAAPFRKAMIRLLPNY